jgi:aspartate aminotransferase/aminotransferase
MPHPWIAERMKTFDSSGIRKVFDLAAKLENPINLSIGQPDFDVPKEIQEVATDAIRRGRNAYSPTQGIPVLLEKLTARVATALPGQDRKLFITSGTSGGLMLALMSLVNPGDEVIVFDPYFVMYPALVGVVGGKSVYVDTYPDFRIDVARVAAAITPRTKVILFNSPANPTGAMASAAEVQGLAELAAERKIALISDEIYRSFCYDEPFVSPATFNPDVLVIDGFSKSHGMTGWRLGFAHGPPPVIEEMLKLQQYSFVCAPQPFQWAAAAALDVDMKEYTNAYRAKRDLIYDGLREAYDMARPGGAFYLFPKAPWGTGSAFVTKAIERGVLIIPGNIFSQHDTHFRISYAASDATLQRGIDALRKLADGK